MDGAIERVIDLVNEEVARFEQLATRMPSFGSRLDARIQRYLDGQRAWMSGNLLWSLATGRYVDPESPFLHVGAECPAQTRAVPTS